MREALGKGGALGALIRTAELWGTQHVRPDLAHRGNKHEPFEEAVATYTALPSTLPRARARRSEPFLGLRSR